MIIYVVLLSSLSLANAQRVADLQQRHTRELEETDVQRQELISQIRALEER